MRAVDMAFPDFLKDDYFRMMPSCHSCKRKAELSNSFLDLLPLFICGTLELLSA
jgi:hypothetical protein